MTVYASKLALKRLPLFPFGEILARRHRSSELVTAGENYDQLKCNQASALGFLSSLRGDDTEWADGQQIFERMCWKKTRNQLCFRYMYTNSKSLSLIIFIYKYGEVSAEEKGSCKAIECIIKTSKNSSGRLIPLDVNSCKHGSFFAIVKQ